MNWLRREGSHGTWRFFVLNLVLVAVLVWILFGQAERANADPTWTRVESWGDSTNGNVCPGTTNMTFSGSWTCHVGSPSSPYNGTTIFQGTRRYSNTTGDYFEYTCASCDGLALLTNKGTLQGIANVSIDGGSATAVDLYNATDVWQQRVFEVTGLELGEHTIRVTVSGTKNASATAFYLNADAIEWSADSTPPTTTTTTEAPTTTTTEPPATTTTVCDWSEESPCHVSVDAVRFDGWGELAAIVAMAAGAIVAKAVWGS